MDWCSMVQVMVDVMLGAIALVRGVRSLDTFNLDMDMRGVAPQRQNKVSHCVPAMPRIPALVHSTRKRVPVFETE